MAAIPTQMSKAKDILISNIPVVKFSNPNSELVQALTKTSHFTCVVCQEFAWDIRAPACDHCLCKLCCDTYFRGGHDLDHKEINKSLKKPCPSCKTKSYSHDQYVPYSIKSPTTYGMIQQLQILCPLHPLISGDSKDKSGCLWTGTYGEGLQHVESQCEYRIITCQPCQTQAMWKEMKTNHLNCKQSESCPICHENYTYTAIEGKIKAKEQHLDFCAGKYVKCDCCEYVCKRQWMMAHMLHGCVEFPKLPPCPLGSKCKIPSTESAVKWSSSPFGSYVYSRYKTDMKATQLISCRDAMKHIQLHIDQTETCSDDQMRMIQYYVQWISNMAQLGSIYNQFEQHNVVLFCPRYHVLTKRSNTMVNTTLKCIQCNQIQPDNQFACGTCQGIICIMCVRGFSRTKPPPKHQRVNRDPPVPADASSEPPGINMQSLFGELGNMMQTGGLNQMMQTMFGIPQSAPPATTPTAILAPTSIAILAPTPSVPTTIISSSTAAIPAESQLLSSRAPKCPNNHDTVLYPPMQLPPTYFIGVQCNKCLDNHLIYRYSHYYHCALCKWDLCGTCAAQQSLENKNTIDSTDSPVLSTFVSNAPSLAVSNLSASSVSNLSASAITNSTPSTITSTAPTTSSSSGTATSSLTSSIASTSVNGTTLDDLLQAAVSSFNFNA